MLASPSTVLLTGATGMVGRYLLRDLLLRDQTVVVIGRGRGPITGEDRIEALLQDWEQRLQRRLLRPVFIEGQLTEPGLGIRPDSNQRMVLEATDVVLHCAASLRFEEDQAGEEPIRTNLTGTKHVIDFAEAWGIPHFHHISTAYVCGCRTGTVRENELDAGQSFHNIYEHSKFQAEQLLAATGHFQSKTIYRPSIIVGDSLTGFTSTFHTVYSILKFVRALPDEHARNLAWIFQRLNLKGDERKNLVPVDWVSQTICDILDRPTAWGQTFHLTNPQPPKVSELSAAIEAAIVEAAGHVAGEIVRVEVLEAGELAHKAQLGRAGGAVPLLGNDDLAHLAGAHTVLVFRQAIVFGAEEEHHHVRILFNGAGFTKVTQLGHLVSFFSFFYFTT